MNINGILQPWSSLSGHVELQIIDLEWSGDVCQTFWQGQPQYRVVLPHGSKRLL